MASFVGETRQLCTQLRLHTISSEDAARVGLVVLTVCPQFCERGLARPHNELKRGRPRSTGEEQIEEPGSPGVCLHLCRSGGVPEPAGEADVSTSRLRTVDAMPLKWTLH
jgi:hypothetical protein